MPMSPNVRPVSPPMFPGIPPAIHGWVDPRRQSILGLASGLLMGDTPAQGLGLGFQYASQGKQADDAFATAQKAEAQRQAEINQTAKWAMKTFPQLQGAPPGIIAEIAPKLFAEQLTAGPNAPPASVQEYEYAKSSGYNGSFADWMQTGKSGPNAPPATVQEWEYFSKLPPNQQADYLRVKRANPYLDVGTGFVQPDPLSPGTVSGPAIPKQNEQEAFDTATGKGLGTANAENIAAAQSLGSKMPGLRAVVSDLSELAKTATYTATGQLIDTIRRETGQEPSDAAVARTKYIAMVDNVVLPLLRDTFGAAFTAKEGETLRATLGDPNKAPAEKQAVLEAFIAQKERDVNAMLSRVPEGSTTLGSGTKVINGVTYTQDANGDWYTQ